jgi:hypothetical protein
MLEYGGKKMSIHAWARELGVPYPTIQDRLRRGWSVARALGTPRKVGA